MNGQRVRLFDAVEEEVSTRRPDNMAGDYRALDRQSHRQTTCGQNWQTQSDPTSESRFARGVPFLLSLKSRDNGHTSNAAY